MDNFYLNEIVAEVAPIIVGRRLGTAALEGSQLRLDFTFLGRPGSVGASPAATRPNREEPIPSSKTFGPRFALVANLSTHDPALYLTSQKRGKRASGRSELQDEPPRSRWGQPRSAQQLLLVWLRMPQTVW
jgi:hypothetical protein